MKSIKLKPADTAFSLCVRHSHNHTCEKCGVYKPPSGMSGSSGMECSHIFSRRHRTIRWCKDNAQCLCSTCHREYGENPADSGRWVEDFVGSGVIAQLREKRDSMQKVTKQDEKDIAKHYRLQLKIIEIERGEGRGGYIDFVSWQ